MRRAWTLAGVVLVLGCNAGPELEIVAVRELGPITTTEGVELRERGYSLFGFGRSLWLFGATQLANPDADGQLQRSNGWSETSDLVGQDGVSLFVTPQLDGGPAELLVLTAEEQAFNQTHVEQQVVEPLTGVRDDVGDRVLVFYAKLTISAAGQRTPIGSSIAVWSELEFGPVRPVLDGQSDQPTLLFHAPELGFGQAALIVGERLYAYGCADELYHPCALARVDLDAVFERDAWQFWNGGTWSSEVAEAISVIEADPTFTVSRNPEIDRYLAFYADRDRNQLRVRSAELPEGPWSEPIVVFTADGPIADGLAHPEYRRGGGRFEYLSYRTGNELMWLELELARD